MDLNEMDLNTAIKKAARKALRSKSNQGQTYDAGGFTGCVQRRRSRETGAVIGIYHCEQAKIDGGNRSDDKPNPWATICETHGHIIGHANLALARAHAADPMGWCDACGEKADKKR